MAKKEAKRGKLIIIGGREDKENECEILSEVARNVGDGRLCIISVASEVSEDLWDSYRAVFKNLGLKNLTHIDALSRPESTDGKAYKAIKDATAIFFTGGDQLKIASEIGGTIIEDKIFDIHRQGGIIAGTSAGASIMGEVMMIAGKSDASYDHNTGLKMAAGLGIAKNIIIDQHFAERGRIGRLLGAIAHNPKFIGIGIDEDTAIVLERGVRFDVIGSGAVYVIDAHAAYGINISETKNDATLSIFDVKLDQMVKGDYFSVREKRAYKSYSTDELDKI